MNTSPVRVEINHQLPSEVGLSQIDSRGAVRQPGRETMTEGNKDTSVERPAKVIARLQRGYRCTSEPVAFVSLRDRPRGQETTLNLSLSSLISFCFSSERGLRPTPPTVTAAV